MKGHHLLALLAVGIGAYWVGTKRGAQQQQALDNAALTLGGQAGNAVTPGALSTNAAANPIGAQLQNLQAGG